uniref:GT23 domain-containing protein n=1 Tax=Ciona savignyi TaxID=51511 RepID=H2YFV1_CIOSA
MVHALEWYDKYQLKMFGSNVPTSFVRNIYIATDDDSIFSEAKQKYPNINFITNGMITKKAAVNSRYSDDGLVGIVADVRVLSHCDYVVCTMSSNVCRLVYELMQTLHTDASKRLHSLDKSYYFIGQWMHLQIAMYNYTKTPGTKEIDIQAGDHLNSDSRIISGVTTWRGTNLRTWKTGRYHTHMVREYSVAAPYSLLPPIDDDSEH